MGTHVRIKDFKIKKIKKNKKKLKKKQIFRGPYSTFLEVIHQAATSKLDFMVSLDIIKGKFSTEKHQLPLDGMTFIIQRPRLVLGSLTRSFMLGYNKDRVLSRLFSCIWQ